MTNLTLKCYKCKKDLIIIRDLEGTIQHFEITDFWAIYCRDCIPESVVFNIDTKKEIELTKIKSITPP